MNTNPKTPFQEQSCPSFVESNLKAYNDGELSAFARWRVERHLTRCVACQEEVEALRKLAHKMKTAAQATPRPELRARILESLPNTPPPQRTQRRPEKTTLVPRYAFATLAFLLVGVGGVLALKGTGLWGGNKTPDEGSNNSKITSSKTYAQAKPAPKPTPEKPVTMTFSNEGVELNDKADALFEQKMRELANQKKQQPQKKNEPQNAYPTVPTLPRVQFTPTPQPGVEANSIQRIEELAKSMGGTLTVDHGDKPQRDENTKLPATTTEAQPQVYALHIPVEKANAFFKQVALLGAVQNVTVEASQLRPAQSQSGTSVPNNSLSTKQKQRPNKITVQPDAEGFITLQLTLKPVGGGSSPTPKTTKTSH
jgi:hypothetical protein